VQKKLDAQKICKRTKGGEMEVAVFSGLRKRKRSDPGVHMKKTNE